MKENMNTYLYEEDEEYFDIFHEEEQCKHGVFYE